MKNDNKKMGFG